MVIRLTPSLRRALGTALIGGLISLGTATAAVARTTHRPARPVLHVSSITPGGAAASGSAPITVRFSAPLPALSAVRRPTIRPATAGHWTRPNPQTLVFTPTGAQLPLTQVTVTVPISLRSATGARLRHPVTHTFTTAPGSTTRVTQLLAQLDYLPEHFVGEGAQPGRTSAPAQHRAAFAAPRGRLVSGKGWPGALHGIEAGDPAVVLRGALMAFQSQHGLAMTGTVSRGLWAALIAARLHGAMNHAGYTYALASENEPESLTIWHDAHVVARSPANTGIPASPTATGTFPVYSRLRSQIMRGTNPDGAPYADPVQYVAYFNGGDAVHYIARSDYGIPQSLGCVELPLAAAAQIWPYLTYGTLVTVAP